MTICAIQFVLFLKISRYNIGAVKSYSWNCSKSYKVVKTLMYR